MISIALSRLLAYPGVQQCLCLYWITLSLSFSLIRHIGLLQQYSVATHLSASASTDLWRYINVLLLLLLLLLLS